MSCQKRRTRSERIRELGYAASEIAAVRDGGSLFRRPAKHSTFQANGNSASTCPNFLGYLSRTMRRRKAFPITDTELSDIANAAIAGESRMPNAG